MIKPYLEDNE